MKILWTGSDSLYQICYPPGIRFRFKVRIFFERIFWRLAEYLIEEHYADHELVKQNLKRAGFKKKISVVPDRPPYMKARKFKKKKHKGFNVLYYCPNPNKRNNPKFIRWLYGWDIYKQLRDELDGINWIVVDGSEDMSEIFPVVDFYLRPNRHDGASVLRQECEINNIPYYWSQQNPDINKAKEEIEKCRKFKLG